MGQAQAPNPAVAIVVMGVAGSGKTAVGQRLAVARGARFIEGDKFHPSRNIALMAAGTPLNDADRADWLDAIGREIAESITETESVIIACSALKRAYRDRLRSFNPNLSFIYLDLDRTTAKRRVQMRQGHFMPASLVESQFDILEPPQPDELAIAVDAQKPLPVLLSELNEALELKLW